MTDSLGIALADHADEDAAADLLVGALEDKRIREGLQHQDVIVGLGITNGAYWRRHHGNTRLRLETCGRVARWLDVPPADVLRWEGYWEKLCPIGKIVAPALLAQNYSQKTICLALDINAETIGGTLWGSKCPSMATIDLLAKTLVLDAGELRRARLAMLKLKPRANPFREQIRRRSYAVVHGELQERGRRLGSGYRNGRWETKGGKVVEITECDRHVRSATANEAQLEHWASITDEERVLWGLTHLKPRQKDRFGLCRGCLSITCLPEAIVVRAGAIVEYHGPCFRKAPGKAYRRGDRLKPEELADYYETTIRYIRVKLRQMSRGRMCSKAPETVTELASQLQMADDTHDATRALQKRVQRFFDLLPSEEVCNQHFLRRLKLLMRFRALLQAGRI